MEPLSSPPSSNTGQQGGFGGQRGGFGGQRGGFGGQRGGFGGQRGNFGFGGFNPMMGGFGGFNPMMGGFGGFNPMMMGLGGMGGYGVFGGGFNPMMGFGFDRGNPMQQGIGSLGQFGGRISDGMPQPSQQAMFNGQPDYADMNRFNQFQPNQPQPVASAIPGVGDPVQQQGGGLQPLNLYKNPQEHQNALRQEFGRNEIQRQLNEQFNRNRASGMTGLDLYKAQDELSNRLYTQYGIERPRARPG